MRDFILSFIFISPVALIFILIGIYCFKKKTPMHFWSGTTVKSSEIKDIKSYNRANGIMWILYGISYFLSFIIEIVFGKLIGSIFMVITCFGGLILMIIFYNKIYNKYKS
ncbi:MAG: hypothetical protein RRZ84_05800 [Romboutsia sp.]